MATARRDILVCTDCILMKRIMTEEGFEKILLLFTVTSRERSKMLANQIHTSEKLKKQNKIKKRKGSDV